MSSNNPTTPTQKVQYLYSSQDLVTAPNYHVIISELTLSELRVYLVLSKHSNSEWVCYPSQRRIASLTKMSVRAVEKAIASLKRKGLVVVQHQWTKEGRQTVNQYRIVAYGDAPEDDTEDGPCDDGCGPNTHEDDAVPEQSDVPVPEQSDVPVPERADALNYNSMNYSIGIKSVISAKNHRSSSASSGEPRPRGAVVSIETTLSSVEEKESSPSLPQLRKNQPKNNSAPPPEPRPENALIPPYLPRRDALNPEVIPTHYSAHQPPLKREIEGNYAKSRLGFKPPDEYDAPDPPYSPNFRPKTALSDEEVSGYYSEKTPPAKRRETPKYAISRERVKAYAKRLGLPYCELLTIAEQLEQEMALRGKRYRNPYQILMERGKKHKAAKTPQVVVLRRSVLKDGKPAVLLIRKNLVDNSEEVIGYDE